jgi:S1-C subfamily serine protease
MRIPDWLVYAVVLVMVVSTLFFSDEGGLDAASRGAPPPIDAVAPGPPLPDPNLLDELVLVQVGEVRDGVGTAFAINRAGAWLTARHVVDGCADVGIVVGGGRLARIESVATSEESDLALLFTDRAPAALPLDLDRDLRIGDAGFHIGYPQGEPGEASSQLLARSRLVTRGRYELEEPVLAWVETGRSRGLAGSLAGMSGGPVFGVDGRIVGVTIAESPRSGRIYTASPDSIDAFLAETGVSAGGDEARPLAAARYAEEAERLRRELAVVKVVCGASPL